MPIELVFGLGPLAVLVWEVIKIITKNNKDGLTIPIAFYLNLPIGVTFNV